MLETEVLKPHTNHSLEELTGKAGKRTIEAFREYAERISVTPSEMFAGLIQRYLVDRESINQIYTSVHLGISSSTLAKTFRVLGVPMLSRTEVARRSMANLKVDPEVERRRVLAAAASWENPAVRDRHIVGSRKAAEDPVIREKRAAGIRKAYEDPEVRKRHDEGVKRSYDNPEVKARRTQRLRELNHDPEFLARRTQAIREAYEDPEVRKRQREGARKNSQDPAYRERLSIGVRRAYLDPEFQSRRAEGIARLWSDAEFRERHAERMRRMLSDPNNAGRWPLPTIQGTRVDIGYAQSTWEANLVRILMYCGRDFIRNEQITLSVPDKYRTLFNIDSTALNLDFVVVDPRGNITGYEIMAHPKENPKGWVKIEMLLQQHPDIPLHLITPRLYYRLREHFEDIVNTDSRFAGWETLKDNLRTNPNKYASLDV